MIDLHCHILPEIDDGPQSLAESLKMARGAVENGIQTIVATPHTLNGYYTNPIQAIKTLCATVQEALARENIPLILVPGAEVHLCPDILSKVETGEAGTMNDNGRYLLLELPFQGLPPRLDQEIFSLKLNNITPIIAHPERNMDIQQNMDILAGLVARGALCQVTALSVTGEFGLKVRQCAEAMLAARLVHVIASDAHSARDRVPALQEAVAAAAEILRSYEEARRMVTTTPAAILAGRDIDLSAPEPPQSKKKKWFFF